MAIKRAACSARSAWYNKFVTNSDPRLSDSRSPQPHNQLFSSIFSEIDNPVQESKNLINALAAKAELEHDHYIDEITDFPAELIPTADEKAALVNGTA